MFGLIVNPKTKELLVMNEQAIGKTYFYYRLWKLEKYSPFHDDNKDKSWIAKGALKMPRKQSFGPDFINTFTCKHVKDIPFHVSGIPRVDSMMDEINIGKGYGTAIYAAATVASIQFDDKFKGRVSSSKESRSRLASDWWNRMFSKGLSDRTIYEYSCFNVDTKGMEEKIIEIDSISLDVFKEMNIISGITDLDGYLNYFNIESFMKVNWLNYDEVAILKFIDDVLMRMRIKHTDKSLLLDREWLIEYLVNIFNLKL